MKIFKYFKENNLNPLAADVVEDDSIETSDVSAVSANDTNPLPVDDLSNTEYVTFDDESDDVSSRYASFNKILATVPEFVSFIDALANKLVDDGVNDDEESFDDEDTSDDEVTSDDEDTSDDKDTAEALADLTIQDWLAVLDKIN